MVSVKAFLGGLFFDSLTVVDARQLSPHFRRLSFTGPSLREKPCSAGDKVQVMLPAVGSRTYSPFAFDPRQGRFDFLMYLHADDPGAMWGRSVALGDSVRVFGPRRSLPLGAISGAITLVGDETSFGVSRSLLDARKASSESPTFLFEVSNEGESQAALLDLGLGSSELFARVATGQHLQRLEQRVRDVLAQSSRSTLVLTGSAQSIQRIRAGIKARPIPGVTQHVKAYWSAGKRGLD